MTPQHFLVPLDFSGYSTQALDYAMELAHKLQARLTLLHVIQSLSMGGDDIAECQGRRRHSRRNEVLSRRAGISVTPIACRKCLS